MLLLRAIQLDSETRVCHIVHSLRANESSHGLRAIPFIYVDGNGKSSTVEKVASHIPWANSYSWTGNSRQIDDILITFRFAPYTDNRIWLGGWLTTKFAFCICGKLDTFDFSIFVCLCRISNISHRVKCPTHKLNSNTQMRG